MFTVVFYIAHTCPCVGEVGSLAGWEGDDLGLRGSPSRARCTTALVGVIVTRGARRDETHRWNHSSAYGP